MVRSTTADLQLHYSLLECNKNILPKLSEQYSDHLLKCLNRWYKRHLTHDTSLACEAVYNTIQFYAEHPRLYNPEHGSLPRYLEISVDRMMQQIFERENYHIQISGIDHILAKYFDNELDIQFAKLMLKNENDTAVFVGLLNIGNCRIAQQLSEVQRKKDRVKKILDIMPDQPSVRKKLVPAVITGSETVLIDFTHYRKRAFGPRQYVL
jgi:hypothetical protein